MNKVFLNNIFYRQNKDVPTYIDIFLETEKGVLKYNFTSLDVMSSVDFSSMHRLTEIDGFREKYGKLLIEEVRKTYDNDFYLLLSGEFILAIEYALPSYGETSVQQFRLIEEIDGINKGELEMFRELEIVEMPNVSK